MMRFITGRGFLTLAFAILMILVIGAGQAENQGTFRPAFTYTMHLTLLDAFSDNLVYFQDNSFVPANLLPVTYIWNFGDGKFATGTFVSHTYNYTHLATC